MKTARGPAGEVSRNAADEVARDARPDACAHQRVCDFYRSRSVPFFAAVVSRCSPRPPARCAQHDQRACPTRLTLVGDLDRATAPLLRECMARIHGNVEIDCSGLDFVGVQGLQALEELRARCESADAAYELVAPTPMLERLLRIAEAVDS